MLRLYLDQCREYQLPFVLLRDQSLDIVRCSLKQIVMVYVECLLNSTRTAMILCMVIVPAHRGDLITNYSVELCEANDKEIPCEESHRLRGDF